MKKVFVDANLFKLSVIARKVRKPYLDKIKWGDREEEVTVYSEGYNYPLEKIDNPKMTDDAMALYFLAEAAKRKHLQFVASSELNLEVMGLPKLDSVTGTLFGAKFDWVGAPIKYGRVVSSGRKGAKELQYEFLSRIENERFRALQKASGAFQGKDKPLNHNQLLDAFHLWCAEHNECEALLTVDYKFAKVIKNSKIETLPIQTPREFVGDLTAALGFWKSAWLFICALKEAYKIRKKITEPWGLNFKG